VIECARSATIHVESKSAWWYRAGAPPLRVLRQRSFPARAVAPSRGGVNCLCGFAADFAVGAGRGPLRIWPEEAAP